MTVLVTGASGHIGANLTRMLLARGERVRALVHESTEAIDGLDVERVEGDVADPDSLRRAMEGVELTYHLAAVISISGREEPALQNINVGGPRNVAQACLDCGVKRLVHFSSTHALSEHPRSAPITEENAPADKPSDLPYDRSKAMGEAQILAAVERGLDAVIVNPCGVIGPIDYRPSHMGQVLLDLYHKKLPGLVRGGYHWVDVRDVCDGAIAAAERGRTGERYILTSAWESMSSVASFAESATGVKAPGFVSPMWMARMSAPIAAGWSRMMGRDPKFTSASLHALASNPRMSADKARKELGFSPRSVADSIRDSYAWFEETGRLPAKGAK